MNIYLCVCVDIQMIIYFLIENFDVDHSPQCFENTQHIIAVCLVQVLGQRSADPNMMMKRETFQRERPSSQCNTFLSTLPFTKWKMARTSFDRQVDQKGTKLSQKCGVFILSRFHDNRFLWRFFRAPLPGRERLSIQPSQRVTTVTLPVSCSSPRRKKGIWCLFHYY